MVDRVFTEISDRSETHAERALMIVQAARAAQKKFSAGSVVGRRVRHGRDGLQIISTSSERRQYAHCARMMVARPRAVPMPRPLSAFGPCRLNLESVSVSERDRDSHRCIGEHVWHDEQPDHRPANVDLVELGHAAVSLRDCDLFQGHVEIVLGCRTSLTECSATYRRRACRDTLDLSAARP